MKMKAYEKYLLEREIKRDFLKFGTYTLVL